MTRILVQRGSGSNPNRTSSLPSSSLAPSQPQAATQVPSAVKDEEVGEELQEQTIVDDTLETCENKVTKTDDLLQESVRNDNANDDNVDGEKIVNDDVLGSGDLDQEFGGLRINEKLAVENEGSSADSSQIVNRSSYPPPPPVPPPKHWATNSNPMRFGSDGSNSVRIGSPRRAVAWPIVSTRTSPTGSRPSSPRSHGENEGYNSADEQNSCFVSSYDDAERERQFEIDIRRAKGLEVKRMVEDGNCLFRAVADQVYGDSEAYDLIRQMCIDYMERERDHFSQFITEGFMSYCKRKRRDKAFSYSETEYQGCNHQFWDTIDNAIEDSIMWPVRKVVPILPGDYSDLELKPVGTLEVKLVQAKELTNKDIIGKSDPFAVLYVRPLPNRMKTSKTINNQLNPVWNEHFEFIVEDASTQHLVVKIYDNEGLQASELIGCAQVQLCELEPGKVKDAWWKLVKDLEVQRDTKNRGQVHLELLYVPFGMENGFTNPFAPKFSMTSLEKVLKNGVDGTEVAENGNAVMQKKREVIVRGVLSITVISAEDLPVVDLMGKADPYVVLILKKSEIRNKTRVVNDSLNPVWNQTFDFVVEDGLHDMLILEVWDHDTFGKDYMGRCILTLTRVILEGEYKETFQLDEAKSGRLNLHLKWMPQPIYRDRE